MGPYRDSGDSEVAVEELVSGKDDHIWRSKSLLRLFSIAENLSQLASEDQSREEKRAAIVRESMEVLRMNDRGGYTVPSEGLYPFQWNWDSAIVSAGWAVFDEARAWEELEMLFSEQWEDGMIASINFHQFSNTYFPGPEIWGTAENPSRTSGITQPPVAALAARFLYENAESKPFALAKVEALFPKLLAWHRWWYKARDPENKGVVAILHPWESGMDNSPAWDETMKFPVDTELPPYERRDLSHVDANMRPTKDTYDHYLTLLYRFKNAHMYNPDELYSISPFRVTDLCVNSILFRANRDLRWLGLQLGKDAEVVEIERWLDQGVGGFQALWDEEAGYFKCQDQLTGRLADAGTSAAFLPLFAGVASKHQAARLVQNLDRWLRKVQYGVPSLDPEDPRFDQCQYWRGPVWLIINWMISNGLRHYGYEELANRITENSVELTNKAGLREYFDPVTGAGCGGRQFSWTAAMCLAWLDRGAAVAIGHKLSDPKNHLK